MLTFLPWYIWFPLLGLASMCCAVAVAWWLSRLCVELGAGLVELARKFTR